MTHPILRPGRLAVAALVLSLSGTATTARGQSGSMFGDATRRQQPLSSEIGDWQYQKVEEQRPVGLHTILTVRVDERSSVVSEGEIDRRKKASLDAVLGDWTLLNGLALIPDPQSAGDPKISGSWNNKYRAEAGIDTRDAMQFDIAVKVVDVRPNKNLVLEGHRTIRNNNEQWIFSISGVIRPEDIQADNTILSRNIAELQIDKRESGHVRDGYRRGWLMQWLDRYQPF